jgi:hypothetical protein
LIFRGKNTRAAKRYTFRMPIQCSYDVEDCDMADERPVQTFTTDISDVGLGMYSQCPAREGQLIKIFLRHVSREPILGEVRWCRGDMGDLYKIGVRYLSTRPTALTPQG